MNLVEWVEFAIHLHGIKYNQIQEIRADYHTIAERKLALYDKWLRVCPSASWQHVIHALETVRENEIASDISKG